MVDIILIIIIVVLLAERLGKLIPDNKTGVVGFVRKTLKLIAGYTENIR